MKGSDRVECALQEGIGAGSEKGGHSIRNGRNAACMSRGPSTKSMDGVCVSYI